MSVIKSTITAMRPPFLLLTPICIFLGVGLASHIEDKVSWFHVILAMIAATSAHIAANTLNEYQDFRSGLDLQTKRTPFSGGSGALPTNPQALKAVLVVTLLSLAISITFGAYLAWHVGPIFWVLGFLGITTIITYTKLLNKIPLLCLVSSGFCFGVIMVLGGFISAGGKLSSSAILVSLVPFFLVNNLLLLNQFPDAKVDEKFGRRHAIIAWGDTLSSWIYLIFLFCSISIIVYGSFSLLFPMSSLFALLPICLALVSARAMFKYRLAIGNYPQFMAMNVAATLLTPLTLSMSLFWS